MINKRSEVKNTKWLAKENETTRYHHWTNLKKKKNQLPCLEKMLHGWAHSEILQCLGMSLLLKQRSIRLKNITCLSKLIKNRNKIEKKKKIIKPISSVELIIYPPKCYEYWLTKRVKKSCIYFAIYIDYYMAISYRIL